MYLSYNLSVHKRCHLQMKSPVITILAISSVFVMTPFASIMANPTQQSAPQANKSVHKPMTIEQRIDAMEKRLSLTAAQKEKMKALLQKEADQLRALKPSERKEKGRTISQSTHMEMHKILTPSQINLLHGGASPH